MKKTVPRFAVFASDRPLDLQKQLNDFIVEKQIGRIRRTQLSQCMDRSGAICLTALVNYEIDVEVG